MRRTTFLLLASLLLTGAASAQSIGEIRGRVLDPKGAPVFLASISTEVNGALHGTTTDLDGKFVLKPLPPGMYSVRIGFVGYVTLDVPGISVVSDRATYLPDQRMVNNSGLDTLVIVGYRRKPIDIDDPSRMSLLAEDFERDPNKRDPIAFIGSNFAGVTPSATGDGLHFRGSRTENMVSFIDGVKVSGAMPRIPPSAIGSVSVYTGGLPAKYGDVTGGVVVIETKTYQEVFQAHRARMARQAEDEVIITY
jgi:hypothetical protein